MMMSRLISSTKLSMGSANVGAVRATLNTPARVVLITVPIVASRETAQGLDAPVTVAL